MLKETWIHTFEIKLPEQWKIIKMSGCKILKLLTSEWYIIRGKSDKTRDRTCP